MSTIWLMYRWCRKFILSSNHLIKSCTTFFILCSTQCWNQKIALQWLLQTKCGTKIQFEVHNCIFVNTCILIYSATGMYVIGMFSFKNYIENSTIEFEWINAIKILYVVITNYLRNTKPVIRSRCKNY